MFIANRFFSVPKRTLHILRTRQSSGSINTLLSHVVSIKNATVISIYIYVVARDLRKRNAITILIVIVTIKLSENNVRRAYMYRGYTPIAMSTIIIYNRYIALFDVHISIHASRDISRTRNSSFTRYYGALPIYLFFPMFIVWVKKKTRQLKLLRTHSFVSAQSSGRSQ